MPAYLDTLNQKFPGAFTTGEFRDNKRVLVSADRAPDVLLP
jgi:NADH-quinone oxidoreductase subunit C